MRQTLWIILLLTLLGLGGASAASAQPKSFVWQRIDTDVQVQPDGTLRVVETLTLRFSGGTFTFAYRDLPERRLDGISNIAVADDEQAYRQVDDESEEPFTYAVFREDGAQRVRWVYPPSDSERTFRLSYNVAGAVRRYEVVDEVWWSMVFPDREAAVIQASGRIALPERIPSGQLAADAPDVAGDVDVGDGVATVSAANIAPGDELSLRLTFPKGVIDDGTAPQWQLADEAQQRYNATTRPTVNLLLSAAAAVLAALCGAAVLMWYRRNRDPRPSAGVPASFHTLQPPTDLPPALAAQLAGKPNHNAFMATLLDLANRGYVSVVEQDEARGKRPRIELTRMEAPLAELLPFERHVLETVFGGQTTVELNERATEIGKQLGAFDQLVQAELEPLGYLRPDGRRARNIAIGIGAALLLGGTLALIPAFVFAERISWWLPVLVAVLPAAGIALVVAGSMVRGLTPSGVDERRRWRVFDNSLRNARPGSAPDLGFAELLPFAYAFGTGKRLSRAYGDHAGVPVWYYSSFAHGSNGGSGASEGMGGSMLLHDFSQNFLQSLDSTASSAAGSGSGGGGGGGGASGGGGGGAG